jgi:5,10-methylenetetrahydromethanopterin reductase
MIKFGFGAVPEESVDRFVSLVQAGEALGFEMVWVPDQTFFRDPFVVMSACAQATERIKLTLGVTNPYTRHPVQVARAAATLDEVSGGRFSVGYGAGNRKELLLPMGMEQTEAGPRCREAVSVTKRLLAGEEVHYHSDTLEINGVQLLMPPRPSIPIYLAGRGPYILKAAGEVADGAVIGALVSPVGLQYAIDRVAEGARQANRTLDELEIVSWVGVQLVDDQASAIESLKTSVAHIIGGAPVEVLRTIGMEEERIQELKDVYRQGGPAGAAPHVTADEVSLLKLFGDGEQLSIRIKALADAGVNQLGILLTQKTHDEQEAFLRRFASEVMPHFR